MPDYIQLEFTVKTNAESELLIALLSNLGFSGFEELQGALRAYIGEVDYCPEPIEMISNETGLSFIKSLIPETNWNQVWESNFEPVEVDDFVFLRAAFHEARNGYQHEIVITPKMSFGTGHHATTAMMIRQMRDLDFANKEILDFGTGSGVLAILAEKLGASRIIAIDNDPWSVDNCQENAETNLCSRLEIKLADNLSGLGKFDIILANINKHILIANMKQLSQMINSGGTILLSGFLESDRNDFIKAAGIYGLNIDLEWRKEGWLCLRLTQN